MGSKGEDVLTFDLPPATDIRRPFHSGVVPNAAFGERDHSNVRREGKRKEQR